MNKLIFVILTALLLGSCAPPTGSTASGGTSGSTPGSTSSPGASVGKLSLSPLSSGTGATAGRSAVSGPGISAQDQALVSTLASSGLTNYTSDLSTTTPQSSSRTVVTDAGNILGSVTVGSSGYILFILQNTGTAPLYDVQFQVSDGVSASDFTLSPGTLSILNTASTATFVPLVTLNIQHGNVISNGQPVAGTFNYLPSTIPASANVTATVKIYAWNTAAGADDHSNVATADQELTATLLVTVKTASWSLVTDSSAATLIPWKSNASFGTVGGDATPYIKNTGNVPISLLVEIPPTYNLGSPVVVAPGAVAAITAGSPTYFSVETNGVVYPWTITASAIANLVAWRSGTSLTNVIALY